MAQEPVHTPGAGCLEIGILLFPEHRGRGLGTAAQRLLADYLFATTLANARASCAAWPSTEDAGTTALYARLRDDPV